MDELLDIMQEILIELRETNTHLRALAGSGITSMDDIYKKFDEVMQEINSIKGPTGYDLTDIYNTLSDIELNTSSIDMNTGI